MGSEKSRNFSLAVGLMLDYLPSKSAWSIQFVELWVYTHDICSFFRVATCSSLHVLMFSCVVCSTHVYVDLDVEWKLRAHTTNDVQTPQFTQYYAILVCCWCHWCKICWFVIYQLFFLKFDDIAISSPTCCTFSFLDVEWKLCAHTTSDVQTSKPTQRYTILACCWYQWCEYCRFVIFQLFFLKYLWKAQKAMVHTSVFFYELK